MKEFKADLHIHTCLSPCGDLEMLPPLILKQASKRGLDIIAICDHNSSENVPAVIEAAKGSGISVIGGIEITTKEEVHILALVSDLNSLKKIQKTVYQNLEGKNDPTAFGEQVIVDKDGNPVDINDRLLIGSTRLSLENAIRIIHESGGLAVASHIDREGFGLISQIGFIPENLPLDGVEISSPDFKTYTDKYTAVFSSDAHSMDEIGKKYSKFYIESPSFSEIMKAFRKEGKRRIEFKGT